MTTNAEAGAATGANSETAATGGGAVPSSGAAGAAAPAAGATPAAGEQSSTGSAAPAAGEAGKAKGGFLDGPGDADDGGGKQPTAEEAAAATARMEAFTKAEGADARKQAWEKLNDAEKAKAAEGMTDEQREELGVEKKPADGAVTYTDFKLPDGVKVDGPLMEKATAIFKERKLDQDTAQALVDFYAGDVTELIAKEAAKPYELWRDTQNEWIEEVHKDSELGGAKNQAARSNAARAIDTLLSKEEAAATRAALTFTGATNNPHIFRLISRMGAKISEGRYVGGEAPAPAPKQAHEVMYPTTVKGAE